MKKYSWKSKSKPVALIDNRGVIMRIFRSQSEAAACTDTDQSKISKICRGDADSVKGKRFKFISNELFNKLVDTYY